MVRWEYAYESDPIPYRPSRIGVRLRFPRREPGVVRVGVSRSDPRFALAIVELRDARGRRRPGTEARVLLRLRGDKPVERIDEFNLPWRTFESSGVAFRLACTAATPKAVRDLVCPSPWKVLSYPPPRIRLHATARMRVRSSDVHDVDWTRVVVPGAACGATRPIRTTGREGWGAAFVRSGVFAWWPAVDVTTAWNGVRYGDLDRDGRDEAALDVVCGNAGGTAAGQLAFSTVIYGAREGRLRSLGIVTPRQPLDPYTTHVPIVRGEIRAGKVVAHEAWYGRHDGTCCASGRARTVWTYANGRLRPGRTVIVRAPRR